MGGRIEDWIINILHVNKMTVRQIYNAIEKANENRTYGTVNKHLRKMFRLKQLNREKGYNGSYVYWNPAMIGREEILNRGPRYLDSKVKII